MPFTHTSLHYHVVFSTKEHCKFIDANWRARLHGYLGGIIKTVSPTNCDVVGKYILNQEEHHRVKTFQEEYREFLEKAGVKYDERFLW